MEFPTIINWNSPYLFKGMLGGIFHFYSNFNRKFYKQTVKTLIRCHIFAASDLGVHCLSMSHKKYSRLIFELIEFQKHQGFDSKSNENILTLFL